MKQFDILHSHFRTDLIAAVNASLAQGWELHGHMSTSTPTGGSTDYLQPMVKELTYLEVLAMPPFTSVE